MPVANLTRIRNFIDGDFATDPGRAIFDDINPATGEVVAAIEEATHDDVDRAVQAARKALNGPWGKMTHDERSKILHRVADGIDARFDDFLRAEILDTGKPVATASHLDIPRGAANFRVFADTLKHAPGEFFDMKAPDGRDAINYTVRIPRGVVAVICPWNLPLLLMTWKVGPALACGNAVIVKPSEETPATATLLAEVMKEAGVPDGVYNVVHGVGPNSAGQFLTEHPDVDGITFTGETGTGEAIMKAAAVGVRPVSFELGGKNPGIIFDDCDLDRAIAETVRAAYMNAGQICLQTERLYVQRGIFDRFVEGLAKQAKTLKPGDPFSKDTTIGPVISKEHLDKVTGYYDRASQSGANIVTGGGVYEMGGEFNNGFWVEPTIWTGLPESSPIIREEIFGPCVHVTPFDHEGEAVTMANATDYGLASMLWTQDVSRAHRVARQLKTGVTWVNSWFVRDLRTAFGGMGRSGIGREGGVHGLDFYTQLHNICIKL